MSLYNKTGKNKLAQAIGVYYFCAIQDTLNHFENEEKEFAEIDRIIFPEMLESLIVGDQLKSLGKYHIEYSRYEKDIRIFVKFKSGLCLGYAPMLKEYIDRVIIENKTGK